MMNASRILLALSLALSPLACTATIVSGGTGADGTAGSPSADPSGGNPSSGNPTPVPPSPAPTAAVAYSGAALNACASQIGGSGSTGSGGPGADPATLFLTVGSPASCTCPFSSGDCGTWEVTIGLPPESQQAGTVVDLTASTNSSFGESSPPEDAPDSCEGGGGSFVGGTLEIVSIDDTQVTFTLSGTTPLDFGYGSPDGTYTAQRCP